MAGKFFILKLGHQDSVYPVIDKHNRIVFFDTLDNALGHAMANIEPLLYRGFHIHELGRGCHVKREKQVDV